MLLKNMVWGVGYKKFFAGGGLIFNRRVGNISEMGGFTRKRWGKNRCRWGVML